MGIDQGDINRPGPDQAAKPSAGISRRGFLGVAAGLAGTAALAALAGSRGESSASPAESPAPVATEVTKVDEREMGLRMLKDRVTKYFNPQSRASLDSALQQVDSHDAAFTVSNNGAGESRYMLDINNDGAATPDFTLTITDMDDMKTTELAFNLNQQAVLTTSEQKLDIPGNQLPDVMEAALNESESPQKKGLSWRTVSSQGMKGASAGAKIPGKAQGEAIEMQIFHTGSGSIKETVPQV